MSKGWFTAPKLFGQLSNRWSGGVILLIILIAVASALTERREQLSFRSTLVPGDPMPVYTVQALDGTEVSLGDFQGSVVLLNFWATWCSSCVDQFTDMQLLKDEFEGQALEIVSVNLDGEDRTGAQEFWGRRGYGWMNLFDEPDHVEEVFGWGDRYPKTVLVNRDGSVGVWWQGRVDLTLPGNRAFMEEAISGRVVWEEGRL
jgi:peroxiredoxin